MSGTVPMPMRAILQDELGGPEVLRLAEVARPRPGPGEVLVAVHACGVNPVDWKTRQRGGFLGTPPFVLGWDVSGEAAGEAAPIAGGRGAGRPVFGLVRFPDEAGGYAEWLTAPRDHLIGKPPWLTHAEAAALPLAGLTAWQALTEVASLRPGQRVLVHAAAGGVGHLAVQIARALGAEVFGTAREEKHPLLRDLGVHRALDYRRDGWRDDVRGIDVVVDPYGLDVTAESWRSLRRGGHVVTLRTRIEPRLAALAAEHGVMLSAMTVHPDRRGLLALVDLLERGRLRVLIDRTFPLSQVAAAHRLGESGRTTGKIVLVVRDESGQPSRA